MLKLLSFLVLFLMVALLIPTGLVLASQDAVPGDSTYPVKRQLEEVILSIASLNSSTKTYFRVDFSKRRLRETTQLLERGKSTEAINSLTDLNKDAQGAINDINTLKNNNQKLQYINDLLKQVNETDNKLNRLQNQAVTGQNQTMATKLTPPPTSPATGRLQASTPTPTTVSQRNDSSSVTTIYRVSPEEQEAIRRAKEENDRLKKQLEEAQHRTTQSITTTSSSTGSDAAVVPTVAPTSVSTTSPITPTPTLIIDRDSGIRFFGVNAAGEATPTPTNGGSATSPGIITPTSTPTPPPPAGCPDGSVQVQCMSDQEKTVYGAGVNAVCYNASNQGTGNICYPGCGACN